MCFYVFVRERERGTEEQRYREAACVFVFARVRARACVRACMGAHAYLQADDIKSACFGVTKSDIISPKQDYRGSGGRVKDLAELEFQLSLSSSVVPTRSAPLPNRNMRKDRDRGRWQRSDSMCIWSIWCLNGGMDGWQGGGVKGSRRDAEGRNERARKKDRQREAGERLKRERQRVREDEKSREKSKTCKRKRTQNNHVKTSEAKSGRGMYGTTVELTEAE